MEHCSQQAQPSSSERLTIGRTLNLPPAEPGSSELEQAVPSKKNLRIVGGALALQAIETGGRRRGYRVRADGKKVAIPLSSYDRLPASEAMKERERIRRALGKGVSGRIAKRQKKTTVEDEVLGRRLMQYKLLGRSALVDFE